MSETFDFSGNVQRLGIIMQALTGVDLDAIISTVGDAHTLGPFIDPTKYRDALYRGDMDALADLAEALNPALKIWRERIEPRIGASA